MNLYAHKYICVPEKWKIKKEEKHFFCIPIVYIYPGIHVISKSSHSNYQISSCRLYSRYLYASVFRFINKHNQYYYFIFMIVWEFFFFLLEIIHEKQKETLYMYVRISIQIQVCSTYLERHLGFYANDFPLPVFGDFVEIIPWHMYFVYMFTIKWFYAI